MLKINIPLFEIDEKHTKYFKEQDLFNNNKIEGYINRRHGSLYGALFITKVNGEDTNQFIFPTPKMTYPFDRDGEWKIPEFNEVRIYEKLDGTNILSYVYEDKNGNEYLTFKTRLRPTLNYQFYNLWGEVLDIYPEIYDITFTPKKNFSFELYGKKNKIYLVYKDIINTALLFTRNAINGKITTPERYRKKLPVVKMLKRIIGNKKNIIEEYNKFRQYLETTLIQTPEGIAGIEGAVWYFCNKEYVVQMKCKPPKIEDLHFRKFKIPYTSIYTTIMNAFENVDEKSITVEFIKELLAEEFTEMEIIESEKRIDKILTQVLADRDWQKCVIEDYVNLQEKTGWSIETHRNEVMSWFAKKYPKQLCGKIYRFLADGK